MSLNLFHHSISFSKADPLGDGLGDDIEAERLEPEAIVLEDGVVEGELEAKWEEIQEEIREDPEWRSIDE